MIKRRSIYLLITVLLIMIASVPLAYAQTPIRVTINNKVLALEVVPVVRDGRTLVPMRPIFEALGAIVSWDAATRMIRANRRESRIVLEIGNRRAQVSGRKVEIDVPPVVVQGRTLVPLRFVAEALGQEVNWNAETRVIAITHTPADAPRYEWSRTFGGAGGDGSLSVKQTRDGGFILAGVTTSFGAGRGDAWLIKTDANGKEEWNRIFGGSQRDSVNSVQQTRDGGFIIAGVTTSFGAGREDAWLIKTDANGKEEWNRIFGGSQWDSVTSVQQTRDGGFIMAGMTVSFGAGRGDAWLIKTDANGKEEWSRTFGGEEIDCGYSVQQTRDGGFIITGETESFGAGKLDAWLVKTDASGNKEWSRTFGGEEIDWGFTVQQTRDGGFIIIGRTHSFGAGDGDAWLIKTDAPGNKEWSRTFGGAELDGGNSAQQTRDGGFILAGMTVSFGAGKGDAWVIKTDANGKEEWSRTFGGAELDVGRSVQQTRDGGFIKAGWTGSFGAGGDDAWLIKVAPEK